MTCLLSFVIAIKDNDTALLKTLSSLGALEKENTSFEVLVMNGGLALMKQEIAKLVFPIIIITEPDFLAKNSNT